MPVEYTNRKGDVYYLHEGRTRTGRPRYFFSKDPEGANAESIPAGYEIYESPEGGQVHLRKAVPSAIAPFERELLCEAIRRQAHLEHFLVDVQKNSLVVYLPTVDEQGLRPLISEQIYGSGHKQRWTRS